MHVLILPTPMPRYLESIIIDGSDLNTLLLPTAPATTFTMQLENITGVHSDGSGATLNIMQRLDTLPYVQGVTLIDDGHLSVICTYFPTSRTGAKKCNARHCHTWHYKTTAPDLLQWSEFDEVHFYSDEVDRIALCSDIYSKEAAISNALLKSFDILLDIPYAYVAEVVRNEGFWDLQHNPLSLKVGQLVKCIADGWDKCTFAFIDIHTSATVQYGYTFNKFIETGFNANPVPPVDLDARLVTEFQVETLDIDYQFPVSTALSSLN